MASTLTAAATMPTLSASASVVEGGPVSMLLPSDETLQPSSIYAASRFGTPTIIADETLYPASIMSGSTFGTDAEIAAGAVDLQPSSITSGTSFGTPTLGTAQLIDFDAPLFGLVDPAVGFGSSFGTPTAAVLTDGLTVPYGIGPGTTFGVPTVSGAIRPSVSAQLDNRGGVAQGGFAVFDAAATPAVQLGRLHPSTARIIEATVPGGVTLKLALPWRNDGIQLRGWIFQVTLTDGSSGTLELVRGDTLAVVGTIAENDTGYVANVDGANDWVVLT